MYRRTVCTLVLSTIAGCAGRDKTSRRSTSSAGKAMSTSDQTTVVRCDGGPRETVLDRAVRKLCVTANRTKGETVFETSAKFDQPYVTPKSPPEIEIEITNTSDENAILQESTQMPNPTWDESEPPEIVFLPADHPYSPSERGRWELKSDAELTGSGVAPAVKVEPGETVTLEYDVWDSGRTDGYFDSGSYTVRVSLSGESFAEIELLISDF